MLAPTDIIIALCLPSPQLVKLDNLFAYWNVSSVLFSNHSPDEALVSHPMIAILYLLEFDLKK